MHVGNLLHKWNVENDQACNKLPTSSPSGLRPLIPVIDYYLISQGQTKLNLCPNQQGRTVKSTINTALLQLTNKRYLAKIEESYFSNVAETKDCMSEVT